MKINNTSIQTAPIFNKMQFDAIRLWLI